MTQYFLYNYKVSWKWEVSDELRIRVDLVIYLNFVQKGHNYQNFLWICVSTPHVLHNYKDSPNSVERFQRRSADQKKNKKKIPGLTDWRMGQKQYILGNSLVCVWGIIKEYRYLKYSSVTACIKFKLHNCIKLQVNL